MRRRNWKSSSAVSPRTKLVRIDSNEWTSRHSDMLDTLLEMLKQASSTCEGETFEEKVRVYGSKDVALSTDGENVFILYGPRTIFLEDGELKVDIRGLVFKPIIRKEQDKIILELFG